jgi:hypothetical protein
MTTPYRVAIKAYRRALVYQALVENGFNLAQTARQLGLRRNHMARTLRDLELDADQARANFNGATLLWETKMTEPLKRTRLEETRGSVTKKFKVADTKGYLIVGLYPDGRPGELFIKLDRAGSTTRGFADAWALQFSLGLQYGIPLELMLEKARATRFEPMGFTGEPDIPSVSSVLDYVARWLKLRFLTPRRVVAHCVSCNQDFYTMEESSQHDRDNLIKHKRERIV